MSKSRLTGALAGVLISIAMAGSATAQQQSGMVGSGAPEDIILEVTVTADSLTLSASEFRLAQGGYYRFNLICPDDLVNEGGIAFTAPQLLSNAHLRIVSVGAIDSDDEINFHLQGLNFRQIDCEGLGAEARFSFHPMRKGTFTFTVTHDQDPPREATGQFIVE